MKNRRDFLKAAGGAGAALAVSPGSLWAGGARRPNIIYLFSDEHRYQSMSCTEMPQLKTPNMARMMRQGTSFQYAVSNNPLCVPHRCMLLSGKWSHRTGAVENQGGLSRGDRTLGHVFHEAGYVTGYTGKWHAGGFPAQAGFDWHMLWSNTNEHWNSSWTDLHGSGVTEICTEYQPVVMTDQAISFVDRCSTDHRPFFLMVAWNPPHAVFTDAPVDKKALYPDSCALPWRENADEKGKPKWWESYQGYHAHITAIDEQIGRIFQTLEKTGQLGNTIVIYSADHGSMMNSHGMGNKRHVEDESCRVPFLVTGPSVPAGQVREELFGTIDVFPTLCALAGLAVPGFCDGQDFSANVYGRPDVCDPDSQLLMHVANAKASQKDSVRSAETVLAGHAFAPVFRGVRGKQFTYSVEGHGPANLWDNLSDPLQQKNLINDPAYEAVRQKMHRELEQWLSRAEYPHLHEQYRQMKLPESILQQAADHSAVLPLHHIVTRLKLIPQQYAELPKIRSRYYGKDGKPKDRSKGGKSWQEAEQSVTADVRAMLDDRQKQWFDDLLSREKAG